MAKDGIGARVRRKEDRRFLYGEGRYIGDLRFPRMRDVAFVRSPVAHARLKAVLIPEHLRSSVFVASDLRGVPPLRAVSSLPGFQISEQPPLATDKIRQVGELIAMCVADSRARAEDIAAQVSLQYDELPAVIDMLEAQAPGAPLVHDTVKGNVYVRVSYDGDVESVAQTAPIKLVRKLRTARQVMSPIECRGFIAQWDTR
ncbi:MAG: xanthine dehydrogenase family protein molybdopterin-binding subunit, partial [Pseudomonadota bacterium]